MPKDLTGHRIKHLKKLQKRNKAVESRTNKTTEHFKSVVSKRGK